MNKKIAISTISIVASLTLLGVGVYAQFVATATATSNTFSTTNPSLLISTGGDYSITVGGFTETGIIPGGTPVVHDFWLKNADTDSGATMALTGNISVTGGSGGDYYDHLSLTIVCNGTTAGPASINTWTGGPYSLGSLAPGGVVHCTMSTSLPSGDTTDAGKLVIFTTTFNGSVGS